tara:strand:- start:590 stop:1105 length:516 start_codon:yes stop_codon:yes gene_type:complete
MATPTYIPLATVTLAASSPQVTFTNISQDYSDLVLVWDKVFSGESNQVNTLLSFNGDSSNYSTVYMYGNGSSAASASSTAQQRLAWGSIYTTTNTDSTQGTAQIVDYSATDKHKTTLMRANVIGSNGIGALASASRWASTAAVTSLSISSSVDSFAAGATFKLFGIHGEVV